MSLNGGEPGVQGLPPFLSFFREWKAAMGKWESCFGFPLFPAVVAGANSFCFSFCIRLALEVSLSFPALWFITSSVISSFLPALRTGGESSSRIDVIPIELVDRLRMEIRFESRNLKEIYSWVRRTLIDQQYYVQGKSGKGLVREYRPRRRD